MKRQPTAFEEKVYAAVRMIPPGSVSTYKRVATHLKCGSTRAIGQALRRNPYAPGVPCHRVISSNLTIGGFNGKVSGPEIERKLHLLELEGVLFDKDTLRLRTTERLYDFCDLPLTEPAERPQGSQPDSLLLPTLQPFASISRNSGAGKHYKERRL